MKIYIQFHPAHAGKWIYNGYAHAWLYHGFEIKFIKSLNEIDENEPYHLMITDGMISENSIRYLQKSIKTILYVSPNSYPKPWGDHPNWKCPLNENLINKINELSNIIKWNFSDIKNEFFFIWKNVITLPLAFDNINYSSSIKDKYEYDVCYIGGLANNGFNEKIKIMQDTLTPFLDTKLKCAFFIGQNLSHEQENYILNNSKIALNIHDEYQRVNQLDCNERTFKGLGGNGFLVSDKIKQLNRLFPNVFTSNDPQELVNFCSDFISKNINDINEQKFKNQKMIESNHTYIKRVEYLLKI